MNRFLIQLIAVTFLSVITLNRSYSQKLTLDSIMNAIEKNNPLLKMYEARTKAYYVYAEGARSIDPPQAGAGLFMTPYNVQMWRQNEMNDGMGSLMLSAQQMFSNPVKLSANEKHMKSMPEVEKQTQKAMRNELFSMAKMNYYEWIILKKKLKVFSESEELLNYLVKSTELRYTYGMDKLNAYYKAKGMLGDIQVMKIMIAKEAEQKMISLNTLMNRNKTNVFDIDTVFNIKNYEERKIDTSDISIKRSDYQVLSKNLDVLKTKQSFERSKRLPDLGIKYDHMIAFGKQPQQFSVMAMVTIPIFPWSSKMYKSQIGGLNYEIQSVKYQQQSFLNEVSGNIENIKVLIKTKKEQIELYEKTIIVSMKKNYETALLAYEQNTEELFVVLDAWQNLKLTQLSYLDQLMELAKLQVDFEKELEIK